MKSVSLALVLAALLMSLLSLQQWDTSPWLVAPAAVAIGIAGASSLQGGVSWLSVVFGALSPLAFRWLDPLSSWLAISALCLLWTAPRIWLARTTRSLVVLAGAALALSLLAGWIAAAYEFDGVMHVLAACVFSGAALSLATLIARTDTPVSHALEVTARALPLSPARDTILQAAEFHRTHCRDRVVDSIPGTGWRKLMSLADRRASVHRNGDSRPDSVRIQLDDAIVALAGDLSREAPAASKSAKSAQAPVAPSPGSPGPDTRPEPAARTLDETVVPDLPAAGSATDTEPASRDVESNLVVNATIP